MISAKLAKEPEETLSGQPWYRSPVITLLENVDPAKIHNQSRGPHTIADILMHMIAWTEEAAERLKGQCASDPARRDWPDPESRSFQELKGLFISANEHLKDTIVKMGEEIFGNQVKMADIQKSLKRELMRN